MRVENCITAACRIFAPTLLLGLFSSHSLLAQTIAPAALAQINTISSLKQTFRDAEKKMDSNLVFAARAARGDRSVSAFAQAISAGPITGGMVSVDINGAVTQDLLNAITAVGGTVLGQSSQFGIVNASVPLDLVETLAARPGVANIQTSSGGMANGRGALPLRMHRKSTIGARVGASLIGALTSQGYIAHGSNLVVNNQNITGAGVTVGVLSDSASAARIAALIASGDLPPNVSVLPGQTGPSTGEDEGTAMMEIIHDMAPGANLIFATADTGSANFANNIIALKNAGCKIIVDDFTYFAEGAFQDGPIAQAVNQVTAAGVIYFSSAANSGNLTLGTSGTWEGDFLSAGPITGVIATAGETGLIHNFGTTASPQTYDVLTTTSSALSLKWSDPLGGSANDYDFFVLDSTGTVLKGFSAGVQSGTQDPFEFIGQGTNCGSATASGYCPAAGDRLVVVLYSGQPRALRVDTNRGRLSLATVGSTFGHNAGINTVSTAATYWNSAHTGTRLFTGAANPIETFSSDGPRKIFYNPDGTPITPGNVLFGTNGGVTLQKPDITAADGVSTKTPGFLPFFGTSAAAPHAAAIAALILQVKPAYTPAQVKAAMIAGTVDNMAPGVDRDSGYGIVLALPAVQYAAAH